MFKEIYLGKEELIVNELGEKEKGTVFSCSSFFCDEKSVKRSEFYQAMSSGVNAEKVVIMNKYEYYSFVDDALKKYARIVNINNHPIDYTIVREYELDNSDYVELTLKRGIENAGT